ncbi:MAG: hypothetical protein JRD43_00485 [Deltaproteobacteria bacterium]|nr:hypothetical protein [Deltaproteobacteria bacterium]
MARKKNRLPPFVYITKEMLKSDAFKKLTNASRVVYMLLKAQLKNHEQTEVIFPYSDAMEYMQKRTFAGAIKQLTGIGFICKKQAGGLYRRTNIYTFTNEWEAYKKPVRGMADCIRGMQKHTVEKGKKGLTGMQKHTVEK